MSASRRTPLDPAVADLLGQEEQRRRRRRLPRARQAKARRDAARQRATYDVPQSLQGAVGAVAAEEGLSASAVVAVLLADGLRRYREGEITFYGLKRPSRSPRCDWVIEEGVIDQVLQGKRTLEEQGTRK